MIPTLQPIYSSLVCSGPWVDSASFATFVAILGISFVQFLQSFYELLLDVHLGHPSHKWINITSDIFAYTNISMYLKQRNYFLRVGYHAEYPNKIENWLRYGYKYESVVKKEAYGIL